MLGDLCKLSGADPRNDLWLYVFMGELDGLCWVFSVRSRQMFPVGLGSRAWHVVARAEDAEG